MTDRIRVGVLISGRGSNMESLARACTADDYPGRIVTVISNRADAPGLAKAKALGIDAVAIPHTGFPAPSDFEEALHNHLIQKDVELICLAGFMRILSAHFIQNWSSRILNIHPSLLPDYPGLNPQARALADGRGESGCTVHYVIPEIDAGPIVAQARVRVAPDDTVETLSARIMEQEHLLYPRAVRMIAGDILSKRP